MRRVSTYALMACLLATPAIAQQTAPTGTGQGRSTAGEAQQRRPATQPVAGQTQQRRTPGQAGTTAQGRPGQAGTTAQGRPGQGAPVLQGQAQPTNSGSGLNLDLNPNQRRPVTSQGGSVFSSSGPYASDAQMQRYTGRRSINMPQAPINIFGNQQQSSPVWTPQ